ncbi:glycosyltransferase family 2 protein [Pseudalkalibacillus hwajinpoensis]|uniref:glycosyltransferase family 2 protein n=1 Tax=Guptibacillus hwajinpoensis TaxID=208199 RepID=UPI002AA534D4
MDIVIGGYKKGMNSTFDLSIIIPMYNANNTIAKCLDSICINKPIEVILIDDGSSDSTCEICTKFTSGNSKFKYFYQENSGPGAARNNGISHAQGKYIMFLDSDDYLKSSELEKLIDTSLNLNADIIYYNFEQVDQDGNSLRRFLLDKFNGLDKKDIITNTLSWNLPWGQFKLIKRGILQDYDIKFDETIVDSEELIFTISCIEKANKILFTDLMVYKYVKTVNSLSTGHEGLELYEIREKVITSLREKYGDKYPIGVSNYSFASYIQIIKLLAEQYKIIPGYKLYRKTIKNKIKNQMREVNLSYYEKRYQFLYKIIKLGLDMPLFLAFGIRGEYHSKSIKRS